MIDNTSGASGALENETTIPQTSNDQVSENAEQHLGANEGSEAQVDPGAVETQENPEQPRPPRNGYRRKIDRLAQENEQLKRRLSALESGVSPVEQQAPAPSQQGNQILNLVGEPPKVENYPSYEAYLVARVDHQFAVKEAQEKQIALQREYAQKVSEAEKQFPNFREVVENFDIESLPPYVAAAIINADNGPSIVYHLAVNPDAADALERLDPIRAAIKIGEIGATIRASSSQAKRPKASQAPRPLEPTSAKYVGGVDVSKMPWDEYREMRMRQLYPK